MDLLLMDAGYAPGRALLEAACDAGVQVLDTAQWSDADRWEIYCDRLVPLSSLTKKPLRGRVRSHGAGHVRFTTPVLVMERDFFIGEEEILEALATQRAAVRHAT